MTGPGHRDTAGRVDTWASCTRKLAVGEVSVYLTVVQDETGRAVNLIGKTNDKNLAWFPILCLSVSPILRLDPEHGLSTIIRKWLHHQFEPHGGPGQGRSVTDAAAGWLEEHRQTRKEATEKKE
jgi:hypothetical protein